MNVSENWPRTDKMDTKSDASNLCASHLIGFDYRFYDQIHLLNIQLEEHAHEIFLSIFKMNYRTHGAKKKKERINIKNELLV